MLQAWMSVGYIVLLAILVLAFSLWRGNTSVLAIAALVVGIPLWFGWEYARPAWTTGVITGTEVRRSDPDARGNTTDFEYIYMRNRSDRGLELINDDSWWWLKRNSERVFNDAKTAQSRNTDVTLMWNRWRSTLSSGRLPSCSHLNSQDQDRQPVPGRVSSPAAYCGFRSPSHAQSPGVAMSPGI